MEIERARKTLSLGKKFICSQNQVAREEFLCTGPGNLVGNKQSEAAAAVAVPVYSAAAVAAAAVPAHSAAPLANQLSVLTASGKEGNNNNK